MNLLSFLITIFWQMNISTRIFFEQDILSHPRSFYFLNFFTYIMTFLLLLRYVMNFQMSKDYSQNNPNNPWLQYLNIVTKTDLTTITLNGLYFILITTFTKDKNEKLKDSFSSQAQKVFSPFSATQNSNSSLPKIKSFLPYTITKQNTEDIPRSSFGLTHHKQSKTFAKVALDSSEIKETKEEISDYQYPISNMLESFNEEDLDSVSYQKSLKQDQFSPKTLFRNSTFMRQSYKYQQGFSIETVNKWKPQDFFNKYNRNLIKQIILCFSLIKMFLKVYLMELFAIVVIVSSIILRNIAGFVIFIIIMVIFLIS